jgi:hypothetical protein
MALAHVDPAVAGYLTVACGQYRVAGGSVLVSASHQFRSMEDKHFGCVGLQDFLNTGAELECR